MSAPQTLKLPPNWQSWLCACSHSQNSNTSIETIVLMYFNFVNVPVNGTFECRDSDIQQLTPTIFAVLKTVVETSLHVHMQHWCLFAGYSVAHGTWMVENRPVTYTNGSQHTMKTGCLTSMLLGQNRQISALFCIDLTSEHPILYVAETIFIYVIFCIYCNSNNWWHFSDGSYVVHYTGVLVNA